MTFGGRAIVVHTLDQARAALAVSAERRDRITLYTAAGAASYAGVSYLSAMIGQASRDFPGSLEKAVIDCGADAGTAQAALRAGWKTILFHGRGELVKKLAGIAQQKGARLIRESEEVVDLGDSADPMDVCRRWLQRA